MSYHHNSETITLQRDCDAVMVPQGEAVTLPAGQVGYITQALGGSFTVFVDGNLFRIKNQDADALGKSPMPEIALPENASIDDIKEIVWRQLRTCFDPEIPVNIVELGLVYRCDILEQADDGLKVEVDMTLTAPGCGMGEVIANEVCDKVLALPHVGEATVDLVFDPPWDRSRISEAAQLTLGL